MRLRDRVLSHLRQRLDDALPLRPGERLLDIGCGWGGLVRWAAARYRVTALGITLSRPQAEFARERIAGAGLGGRAEVRYADYRDLDGGLPHLPVRLPLHRPAERRLRLRAILIAARPHAMSKSAVPVVGDAAGQAAAALKQADGH